MRPLRLFTGFSCVALALAAVLTAAAPETFKATATIRKGAVTASAPVSVSIAKYSAPADRDAVLGALKSGGTAAVRGALAKMADVGFVQVGEQKTPIKFAAERPTSSGRLVTAVTAQPIARIGAGLPDAKPQAGYDVAVVMLYLGTAPTGELAPAAKIGVDKDGALLIEDYGSTVVWLNGIAPGK